MRESQKNRRTDETEGTGILWPEVSYDPGSPAGQNISFAAEGRDADLSVRAGFLTNMIDSVIGSRYNIIKETNIEVL